MKALIQRTNYSKVEVEGELVSELGRGYLVFLGVEKEDTHEIADKMLQKILKLRINEDENGKMNLSLLDEGVNRGLMIVSQFTLCADTSRGNRPSFVGAHPELAQELYDYMVEQAAKVIHTVAGRFAADMQITLQNDGPVTLMLEVQK